jgi:glycosyltransferase involved in cell wall biosynthesis
MFKVSVIIPVYNAEKFLAKAIDSALIQPETDEVILVEDASPDQCLKICEEYVKKDKRVKLYQHPNKANKGAAESRNLGVLKAKHNYVAFLDADDYYLPERFKKDKELFINDNSIDGVYSAVEIYAADASGKLRKDKNVQNLKTLRKKLEPNELFYKISPVGSEGFFHLNGLTIKKKALIQVGLFDSKLRLSQDTHLSIKLAAKCKLVGGHINQPVARFALHKDNRSQFPEKIKVTRPYLFNDLYRWARKEQLNTDKVYLLWQRFYEFNLLVNQPSRAKQLLLLCKAFIKQPSLIRFRFFRKQLPVLSRFLS